MSFFTKIYAPNAPRKGCYLCQFHADTYSRHGMYVASFAHITLVAHTLQTAARSFVCYCLVKEPFNGDALTSSPAFMAQIKARMFLIAYVTYSDQCRMQLCSKLKFRHLRHSCLACDPTVQMGSHTCNNMMLLAISIDTHTRDVSLYELLRILHPFYTF